MLHVVTYFQEQRSLIPEMFKVLFFMELVCHLVVRVRITAAGD